MNDTGDIQPKPVLGERFMPEPEQVMPMIKAAERRRLELKQGLKSGTEEKPLQEAIWLAEALMNYEKGDASRTAERWRTGSTTVSIPVEVKSDGGVWVKELDVFSAYESAMAMLLSQSTEAKVHLVDFELMAVEDGIATVSVEWSDKDPDSGIDGPYEPMPTGVYDLDEGARLLTRLLHWYFHPVAPEAPSFYVTVSPWIVVTTNQSVEPNPFGFIGYYGTSTAVGGSALLYNGVQNVQCIALPFQWDRLVLAREIVKLHAHVNPPYMILREFVDINGYFTSPQPSVLYPTGYWHHEYHCRVGVLVNPIGP